MVVIGGRTQHPNDKVVLEMYDTDLSEWFKFFPVQRFRHSSWIIGQKVFIHGGFEPEAPSVPTDVICTLNLRTLLANSKLKNAIEATDTTVKK
jgi:protein phosphatase